jgi:hypothetical protein
VAANCGDSRAVLCLDGGKPVPLSSDHKPDRPDELARIEAAGGRVIFWEGAGVLGVLPMSDAIGDGYLKPFVTAIPEVTVTDTDECLIASWIRGRSSPCRRSGEPASLSCKTCWLCKQSRVADAGTCKARLFNLWLMQVARANPWTCPLAPWLFLEGRSSWLLY